MAQDEWDLAAEQGESKKQPKAKTESKIDMAPQRNTVADKVVSGDEWDTAAALSSEQPKTQSQSTVDTESKRKPSTKGWANAVQRAKDEPAGDLKGNEGIETTKAFGHGAAMGATAGFYPRLAASIETLSGKDYEVAKKEWNQSVAKAKEEHPGAYLTGEIGGIAGTTFVPGLGVVSNTAKGATGLAKAIQAGKQAAASGAKYGAASGASASDDLLSADAFKNASTGAVLGGLTGATLGGALPIAGMGADKAITGFKQGLEHLPYGIGKKYQEATEGLARGVFDPVIRVKNKVLPPVLNAEDDAFALESARTIARNIYEMKNPQLATERGQRWMAENPGKVEDAIESLTQGVLGKQAREAMKRDLSRTSADNLAGTATAYGLGHIPGLGFIHPLGTGVVGTRMLGSAAENMPRTVEGISKAVPGLANDYAVRRSKFEE